MLTENIRQYLEGTHFGVLATIDPDGRPQQTVLWYLLRGDEIVMNSERGRLKLKNMERDARVSLCVAEGYRYVTLTGEVRLIDNPRVAQADVAELARRYLGADAGPAIEDYKKHERVSIILPITHVYEHGL